MSGFRLNPLTGELQLRELPRQTGHAGKFLGTDGEETTPPAWDTPAGDGSGGDVYVRTYWFEAVAGGTAGTLTPPTGGAIVLDAWAEGVDALAVELDEDGKPNWQTPTTNDGLAITATLDAGGHWTLSGVPSEYPVGVVYCYRIQVKNLQDVYTLAETEAERPDAPGIVRVAAGETLGGHRVVSANAAGQAVLTDIADEDSAEAVQGITLGASNAGALARVQAWGRMEEASWSWTPGDPVYCAPGAVLTQTVPETGALLRIGTALTPTTILVRIEAPIFR